MKCGFVAIAGRPNAGKSTLLNALFNEKLAIVSHKPQTTRSEIRGILNEEDCQIIFTDTPGIHKPRHRLETRMNKEATNVIQGVDLIYLVVDISTRFATGDEFVLRMVEQTGLPVFLILNKIDKLPKEKVLNNLLEWQKRFNFAEIFPISALEQDNFTDLIETTKSYLPEGEPLYPVDINTDESENFRIAEIIREKILLCAEEEVPHATAVIVENKVENEKSTYIQAMILVERDGQKAILIGKQGNMLRKINISATRDLEILLGRKVKLELFVRVEEEWRDNDSRITEYGYGHIDE